MDYLTIRFYEELNDFLPPEKKKRLYHVPDHGKRSVKDLIESQGVPHTEIDLILINGVSVDLNYLVNGGDTISVYPVFEKFDITGVTKLKNRPLRNLRFILDVHLGKLAKYLRMLGFDTHYNNQYDDEEIAVLTYIDNRVLLTRDIGLLKRRDVTKGYWLRSQHPKTQLEEILVHFDLFNSIRPLTRCMKCNGEIETVSKEKVFNRVLPDTLKYFNRFYRCKNCGKIYWKGSHFNKMMKYITQIKN